MQAIAEKVKQGKIPPLFGQFRCTDPLVYAVYSDVQAKATWYLCEASPGKSGDISLYVFFVDQGEGDWEYIPFSTLEKLQSLNPQRIHSDSLDTPLSLRGLLKRQHGIELSQAAPL
jgi:hypothetical protein